MPLVAIVNGVRTVAPFLTNEQWAEIKSRANILLPCCENPGFKRTSKNGIRHFVHKIKSDHCHWCSETEEHLRLKQLVASACQEAGWQVDIEHSGPDWRADVYASRGGTKLALEIQLSPTTFEELLDRERRYERDGIRGCWFYGAKCLPRSVPWESPRLPARRELPAFRLVPDTDGKTSLVELGRRDAPIREGVGLLLAGKVRFCERQKIEMVEEIHFYYTQCWRCHKETGVYRAGWGKTGCGEVADPGIFSPCAELGEVNYATRPWIIDRAQKFLESKGRNLKVTLPRWDYSTNSKRHYNSFRCYWCDALFGPEFVLRVYEGEDVPSRLVATDVIKRRKSWELFPHWCVSDSKDFCC